jgi:hypothetical protein
MPAIQGRTREQLRQHVGRTLGGLYVSSASSSGSTTTLLDNTLVLGGADNQIGKWVRFTSGSNAPLTRRVTDSAISSNVTTLTFMPEAGNITESESYELWDGEYSPDDIDDFIKQSVIDATGWVYDPIENIELHGDGKQIRFDIPSGISMISKVEYRHKVSSTRIHACGTTFDETTDSDFTQSLDSKDKKQGSQALKIGISTTAEADDLIADSITSLNLSKYDTIEMWVKSTVGTNAGDLKLHLDSTTITEATAHAGNTDEALSIPALSSDTWTFVRMSLANPGSDTAIVSVALELHVDIANSAAITVWIDDIVAVANDTAEWSTLDRRNWKIDKESRDLVLVRDGHQAIGYALMKITGGDKPAIPTLDSDTMEIDEDYLIAQTITLALLSASGGPATDPDAKRQLSAYWSDQAQRAKRKFPMLVGVRSVD